MRVLRLFLPLISWVVCCSSVVPSTNYEQGMVLVEAAGYSSMLYPEQENVSVEELVQAAGFGYGASVFAHILEQPESLIAESEVV